MSIFWTATLLAVRIVLPGALWLPAAAGGDADRGLHALAGRSGRTIALGILLNLLPSLILAQAGHWTPTLDWAAWCGVVIAGAGARRPWRAGQAHWHALVSAAVIVAVSVLAMLALPPRSEWLAGGWDPGIYQNNAIRISQSGSLLPRHDATYAAMNEVERAIFSRQSGSYSEVFPGVPIRLRDGALPVYFFPLSPLCGAWFHRLGGMDLLHRMPAVLALLGLWPACALFIRLGWRGWRLAVGLAFWCLSPMWWYQQAIPTSEMLYILLLTGAILFYLDAVARRVAIPYAAALALLAATINHFNFPVVAGILMAVAAAAESAAALPNRLPRLLTCTVALVLGIAWDLRFADTTIQRLQGEGNVLVLVLGPFALLAALALWMAASPVRAAAAARAGRVARVAALGSAVALAALVAVYCIPAARDLAFTLTRDVPVLGATVFRVYRVFVFHGAPWFLAVALGIGLLARDRAPEQAALRMLTLGLGLVLGSFLLHGGIAPIYPWALRRFVIVAQWFMVLAMTAVAVRAVAGGAGLGWGARIVAGVLLVAAAVDGARQSRRAARVGDYRGIGAVLESLSARIDPADVVVADDPRWGTPLLLIHGRHALNGSLLWDQRDPALQAQFLDALRAVQRRTAGRVLWLTSTEKGLELYPPVLGAVTPVGEVLRVSYQTVIHSRRADHFATRDNTALFRLYAWSPPDPP